MEDRGCPGYYKAGLGRVSCGRCRSTPAPCERSRKAPPPLRALSLDDDSDLRKEWAAARRRRRWGRWHLDVAAAELAYREHRMTMYPIPIEAFCNAPRILNTIAQVHGKAWPYPKAVGDLVHALDDIFGIQGTFRGDEEIDALAYFRSRYGDGTRRRGKVTA